MTRRVWMWVAVGSLIGVAVVSAGTSLAMVAQASAGGWVFYTPYSTASAWEVRVVEVGRYAQMVLVPVAAVSGAVYIVLLDRDVRRGAAMTRGFEVGRGWAGAEKEVP